MPILRYEPGSRAPASAMYALVGHHGEATNVALWCEAGQRLPVVVMATDFGPLWFVQLDEAQQGSRAV